MSNSNHPISQREAKKIHERNVCEAVVRLIEFRRDGNRSDQIRPEDQNRKDKSVELEFKLSGVRFVLEHTLIESYPNQITESHQFMKLLGPLVESLDGRMPTPGHYWLTLRCGVVTGARNGEKIRTALKEWILTHAAKLAHPASSLASPASSIRCQPFGVPFEVTLSRGRGLDGRFSLGLFSPKNLEDQRNERVNKALEDKCEKLQAARGTDGCSVLVLEWNDISLGNSVFIRKALKEQLSPRKDTPDELYLVDTTIPREEWLVVIFKDQFGTFPDLIYDKPYRINSTSWQVKRWED